MKRFNKRNMVKLALNAASQASTRILSVIIDPAPFSSDDGGRGRRGRHQTPLTINKWAKPLPKLDLPPRVHLQKSSKVKQIWELWSVNVALAMSTWNDVAVTYWHQVYIPSEEGYQNWRRSGMADRFAYKKRYLCGRKAPVPATCDSVEALLRHELLTHIPERLSRQAGVSRLYQLV